jgi:NADPH:quinone reductase-like Zn-dependent oxidoreductase
MKAAILRSPGGLERIEYADRPDPGEPSSGEIRVAIKASTVNPHDYMVAAGMIPTADGRVLMADGAGVVEAVGAGVIDFAVGDRVISTFFPAWQGGPPAMAGFAQTPGDGVDGFAQEIVVRSALSFTPAPAGYSHVEAASLTTAGVTAWRALMTNGRLRESETVLLIGTGAVSLFALQIAKMAGARIIITSGSDEKLDQAKAMGADETINYRREASWGAKARSLTGGLGIDHVVEVGGPGTLAQSIEATRPGGHIALIGVMTGLSGDIPTAALTGKQIRLQGVSVGSRQDQLDLVSALSVNAFRPAIRSMSSFAALAEAFRQLQTSNALGKIGLEW